MASKSKAKAQKAAKIPAKAAKPAKAAAAAPKGKAAAAKSAPATKGAPAKGAEAAKADLGKRKLGLRGAAPWAARHAAKHAAEARARAAEPPLPGSARATIRTPAQAEDIKKKIAELHAVLGQVKQLRKNLAKNFFDIGVILRDVQARKLYEAKGYGSFEAFLEREIDLGKTTSLRLVKIGTIFQKEAAVEMGLDKLVAALMALEIPEALGSTTQLSAVKLPPAPISTPTLPLKPPGR
jgi:hypothetical protein